MEPALCVGAQRGPWWRLQSAGLAGPGAPGARGGVGQLWSPAGSRERSHDPPSLASLSAAPAFLLFTCSLPREGELLCETQHSAQLSPGVSPVGSGHFRMRKQRAYDFKRLKSFLLGQKTHDFVMTLNQVARLRSLMDGTGPHSCAPG